MHRPLRDLPDTVGLRRKGYRSEQLLSSSLFRLYLCLGGDTNQRGLEIADIETRCSASHYAVFLIIQALRILDDARVTPANEPNDLVSALIDADVGTEEFVITDPCDDGSTTTIRRVGGCAQKAIRWAFEAQGLYADTGANHNGPGMPPPVDVYIEDARSTTETTSHCPVEHGPGSYVPVSLEVPVSGDGVALPGWFATANAIDVQANQIFVTVSNRGSALAQAVTVKVWQSEWAVGTTPPDWLEGTRWTEIPAAVPAQEQDVAPDTLTTFGPFPWVPDAGKHYLILAQATCEADKANTDPSTSFPCSLGQTPLVDLVANDNNLGVQIWPPPS